MTNSKLRVALTLAVLAAPFYAVGQEKTTTGPDTPATQEPAEVSSRSAVIIREFTVSEKTSWPYDVKQLQSQTVAELKVKSGMSADVLVGPPATPRTHTYTLEGEIVSWRAGNAAKRWVVGMGSGREAADIHYWLTDEQGKRVFEHKDTIRAEFWGNAYAGSVGQLAHPFASKIAARLTEAKVF
jgi:hypothetical protein